MNECVYVQLIVASIVVQVNAKDMNIIKLRLQHCLHYTSINLPSTQNEDNMNLMPSNLKLKTKSREGKIELNCK